MKINGSFVANALTGNFVVGNQGSYTGSYIELTFNSAAPNITETMTLSLDLYVDKLVNVVIGSGVNNGYGKLYNWYAITDARNIANTGWRVPTQADWNDLYAWAGGGAGGSLKEVGLVHWNTPNTSATNILKFNGKGAGGRSYGATYHGGSFYSIMNALYMWQYDLIQPIVNDLRYNGGYTSTYNTFKAEGLSVRLVRITGTVGNGNVGSYTGNDGTVYPTIGIGNNKEWMSTNLKETRYNNTNLIPQVTDNIAWHSLTTGAFSWYNNDSSYE